MDSLLNPPAHDSRPKSMAACMLPDGGGLDLKKYQSYVRYQSDKSRRRITALVASSYEEEQKSTNEYNDDLKSITDELPKKKRRKKKGVMARKNEDGELEVITPQQSSWYQMYAG